MPGYKCYHNISNNSCLTDFLTDKSLELRRLMPVLMNAEIQYLIGEPVINSQLYQLKNVSVQNEKFIIESTKIDFVNMGALLNISILDNNKTQ